MLRAGVLGAFSQRTCHAASSPGGPPEALLIFVQSGLLTRPVVTSEFLYWDRGAAMKISIELDGFALRVLTAVLLSAWAIFGGGSGAVSEVVSLYLILKG